VTGREAVTAANKPAVPTLQQKHPLAVSPVGRVLSATCNTGSAHRVQSPRPGDITLSRRRFRVKPLAATRGMPVSGLPANAAKGVGAARGPCPRALARGETYLRPSHLQPGGNP